MQLAEIFSMQKNLDSHIEENHQLEGEDLFNRKVLALLVELGELANETRCFKFWSVKPSSPKEVILEEFVDGVHFIASIGIECGFEDIEEVSSKETHSTDVTDQFLQVFKNIQAFQGNRTRENYVQLWEQYLTLAYLLGFTPDDVKRAYIAKNEVNYKRQQEGY